QAQGPLFALPARLGLAWGLPLRRREVGVGAPAPAASRRLIFVIGRGEIAKPVAVFAVVDQGADGNGDRQVIAAFAVAVRALTVPAARGGEFPLVAKLEQRV